MYFKEDGFLYDTDESSEWKTFYCIQLTDYDKYICLKNNIKFNFGSFNLKTAQYLCIKEYLQEKLCIRLQRIEQEYIGDI